MKMRKTIFDIALTVLGLALTVGTLTVFGACGHLKEDGSYMNCHWAGVMLTALGCVITVQGAARFFFKSPEAKRGLSIAAIPTAVLAMLVPGGLIPLCMMQTMQCQSVMKPFALVIGILTVLTACADIVLDTVEVRKSK